MLFHQKCSLASFSLIPAVFHTLSASNTECGSLIQEYWISVSHRTQPSSVRLETLFSSPITLSKCLQAGHRYRLMSSSDTDQMDFSRSGCEMRLGKPQNPLKGAPLIGRRPVAEVHLCRALRSAFNWLTGAQTSWRGTNGLQLVHHQEAHLG